MPRLCFFSCRSKMSDTVSLHGSDHLEDLDQQMNEEPHRIGRLAEQPPVMVGSGQFAPLLPRVADRRPGPPPSSSPTPTAVGRGRARGRASLLARAAALAARPGSRQAISPSRRPSPAPRVRFADASPEAPPNRPAYSRSRSSIAAPARQERTPPPAATNCNFCKSQDHRSHNCPELLPLTPAQRYEKVIQSEHCLQCLGGHGYLSCRSPRVCQFCRSPDHHSLLHSYFSQLNAPDHSSGLREQTERAAERAERQLNELLERSARRQEDHDRERRSIALQFEQEVQARQNAERELIALKEWRSQIMSDLESVLNDRDNARRELAASRSEVSQLRQQLNRVRALLPPAPQVQARPDRLPAPHADQRSDVPSASDTEAHHTPSLGCECYFCWVSSQHHH